MPPRGLFTCHSSFVTCHSSPVICHCLRWRMAISRDNTAGLILIGGKSERMGHPKALIELCGGPLWRRAADILTPHVDRVFYLGAVPGFMIPKDQRVILDDPPGIGPLGGLVAGIEQSGYQHHLLIAVDYPLVPAAFLQALIEQSDSFMAVCGQGSDFLEPLVAYYHRDCAPVIRQMIAQGEIRTHKLYDRVPCHIMGPAELLKIDPAKWAHFNVNTPADLREAESRLRAGYPK